MARYARHLMPAATPQGEPLPGSAQVANSAGGFSFAVDDWVRLDRFLVLGCAEGSYYASERKLTLENAAAVRACLAEDAPRTLRRLVEISEAGRAPKNDPAVFALALAAAHRPAVPGIAEAIRRVCRIGTHLFQFTEAVNALRGWGRGLRSALAAWYTGKAPGDLAYQLVKYQSREKWSHRDLLRLCHAKAAGPTNDLFHWAVKGWEGVGDEPHPDESLRTVWAFERAKRAASAAEVCSLVRAYNLPRECVPTQFLSEASVWEALLERMPMTAMIRNLATMTRVGLLAPLSAAAATVCERLADAERLKKARVHPLAALVALNTYSAGRGEKSAHAWKPVRQVVDALDAAFYLAFGAIVPTGKRWLLALDVSGSMGGGRIAGMPGITPRVGSAAMALVTAATEARHHFVAFTNGGWQSKAAGKGQYAASGYSNGITPVDISPRMRLDAVVQKTSALPMGGTDCALPMLYAAAKGIPADVFVVYTDSETWAGAVHPVVALRQYRQQTGIPAKLVVCGMVSNGFTIADPDDAGMLDVVGFDTATPQLMSDFAAAGAGGVA
jgi:60 kDa SS-A/Ro ribonucleoprotein